MYYGNFCSIFDQVSFKVKSYYQILYFQVVKIRRQTCAWLVESRVKDRQCSKR